ncbi:MAG: hypothetical protein KAG28_04300 [Cocleimonas sp.]|nr:hypothetical protein [Cocleimonas sp.]
MDGVNGAGAANVAALTGANAAGANGVAGGTGDVPNFDAIVQTQNAGQANTLALQTTLQRNAETFRTEVAAIKMRDGYSQSATALSNTLAQTIGRA